MAKHNITTSSELVGKNRKTIQRYMKDGRLSYTSKSDGQREIDTSELIRVFGVTDGIKKLTRNVAEVAPTMSQDVALVLKELKEMRRENKELKKDNISLHKKLDSALSLMIEHKDLKRDDTNVELDNKRKTELYEFELFDIPSIFEISK